MFTVTFFCFRPSKPKANICSPLMTKGYPGGREGAREIRLVLVFACARNPSFLPLRLPVPLPDGRSCNPRGACEPLRCDNRRHLYATPKSSIAGARASAGARAGEQEHPILRASRLHVIVPATGPFPQDGSLCLRPYRPAFYLVRVWRFSRSSALQLKGSSTAKNTKLELAQE